MKDDMTDAEDRTGYFWAGGRRYTLTADASIYAVRFKRGERADSAALSAASARLLRVDSEPVGFIPGHGLQIFRAVAPALAERSPEAATGGRLPRAVRTLDEEEAVDFASRALRLGAQGDPMFVTRRFVVELRGGVTPEQLREANAQYGVTIVERLGHVPEGYVLEAPESDGPRGAVALANAYLETGLAATATPDLIRKVHFRSTAAAATLPRASHLAEQWHLATARVIEAWDTTRGDPDIAVAVLDDGVDRSHPEFAGRITVEWDFAAQVADASPKSPADKHGTACAGVAVAGGVAASGAAPRCSLIAVKIPDYLGVIDEAKMFSWVADKGADVISCSWGPSDGTGATDPLPDSTRTAIRYCLTQGRSGRGIPILWAAGNGDESVSRDGYASNPDVIAVAASTSAETRAWYSDYGPEISVCAPSSGSTSAGHRRIFTTDRRGAAGYNHGSSSLGDTAGDYTNDFGGTSSATPLVAGIVGLLLSAAPDLTAAQVRTILQSTADKIGDPSDYDDVGHSELYGHGRVNAAEAVRLAEEGQIPSIPSSGPSITGPASVPRSGPPSAFVVDLAGNGFYAVEVATRWQLLDAAQAGSGRTPDSHFGSWDRPPLEAASPYRLPQDVWERLRSSDRLFYRVHTTSSAGAWTDYAVSTSDGQAQSAPVLLITGTVTGSTTTGSTTPSPSGPSVRAPASLPRSGAPPIFQVSPGTNGYYALEVATRWQLLGEDFADERNSTTYFASWERSPLLAVSSYALPGEVWQAMRAADRLVYRIHTSSSATEWTDYEVSAPADASVPAIELTGGDGGAGSGTNSGAGTVVYPSATFAVVLDPQDDVDYSDPVANGAVPLIEVGIRLTESLSANFRVRELAARRVERPSEWVRYARIDPHLVVGLQSMRDQLGIPLSILSGYRYPALNQDVEGAGKSQHQAGRAADITANGVTPLELARLALEELGPDIGLGLGKGSLHVDVRGETASWVYKGASLSEAEFATWVREACAELRGRTVGPRRELLDITRPAIAAPERWPAASEPPAFTIRTGANPFFAVEVATDWRLLDGDRPGMAADASAFFSSARAGLLEAGPSAETTYTLPDEAWRRLRNASRLFYRVLTTSALGSDWPDRDASTDDEAAAEVPAIEIVAASSARADLDQPGDAIQTPAVARARDEMLWRDPSEGAREDLG